MEFVDIIKEAHKMMETHQREQKDIRENYEPRFIKFVFVAKLVEAIVITLLLVSTLLLFGDNNAFNIIALQWSSIFAVRLIREKIIELYADKLKLEKLKVENFRGNLDVK